MVESHQKLLDAMVAEAQRIEEDAIHSAKGHFEASSSRRRTHLWLGLPAAVLAAVGGLSAIAEHTMLGGVISIVAAAFAALLTFLRPREEADRHFGAGNRYQSLRNDSRKFREVDCVAEVSAAELRTRLDDLHTRRNRLNEESPQIPPRAFERAKQGIDAGQASYGVDRPR